MLVKFLNIISNTFISNTFRLIKHIYSEIYTAALFLGLTSHHPNAPIHIVHIGQFWEIDNLKAIAWKVKAQFYISECSTQIIFLIRCRRAVKQPKTIVTISLQQLS